MSVETRKGKYGKVVSIRYRDKTGRQVRETLGLETEGWSRAKALRVERERIVSGRVVASEMWLFAALANRWFEETSRRKAWKPLTLRAYERSIVRLQFFHKMFVHDIRPKDVVAFIEQSKYAAKTTNDDISVLHGILDYAVRLELIQTNPAYHAPRPKNGRKKWRILTPEEIRRVDAAFLENTGEPWQTDVEYWNTQAQLMFRVLTRTGIRRHELRNLRVGDIDFQHRLIRITDSKTEEGVRSIAIPESLCLQLKEWCERD